jgi:SAM-dependent methyltransferase
MDVTDWVRLQLPPPPARVLEVGCGEGDLARALDAAGWEVTAIDPAAPKGEIFRPLKLEDLDASEKFDAVIARLSLHHVVDLEVGLDKIVALLRPGGPLVLDEFAWDRLDLATAQWFHRQRGEQESLETCCRDWEDEHVGLHGYAAMRAALDARFDERYFAWLPYLHRYDEVGADEAEERALIEAGAIQALGFRYVGAARD